MRVWLCGNQDFDALLILYTQVSRPTSARARTATAASTAGRRFVATSSTPMNRSRRVRTVVCAKRRTPASASLPCRCSMKNSRMLRAARRAGRALTARCRYACRAISTRHYTCAFSDVTFSDGPVAQVLLRSHQGHPAGAGRRGLLPLSQRGLLHGAGHLHLHRRLDGLRLPHARL